MSWWSYGWFKWFGLGCQQQSTVSELLSMEGGCTSLLQPPRNPCERSLETWNHMGLLLDHALCGAASPSHPSHLVFWRVDTSLLSEDSLFFRIQKVIIKKAKLICRNPTRHSEYISHLLTLLLAHPAPNAIGKKLSYFITAIEKQTKCPVTQAHSFSVPGVTNSSQFAWNLSSVCMKVHHLRKSLQSLLETEIVPPGSPLSPERTGMVAHPACNPPYIPAL